MLLAIVSALFAFALIASAWNPKDKASLEDYAVYVSHRESVSTQTVLDILRCESGFNPKAWNKKDPNGGSMGVAQFQRNTFYGFAQKYGFDKPDIWNPFQQINLMIYMVGDGLKYHWSCAKMI